MTDMPRTPAGFTGTRTTTDPESGLTARLRYVDGRVVGIAITTPDGRTRHIDADEAEFKTTHAQSRFVWAEGDITKEDNR